MTTRHTRGSGNGPVIHSCLDKVPGGRGNGGKKGQGAIRATNSFVNQLEFGALIGWADFGSEMID